MACIEDKCAFCGRKPRSLCPALEGRICSACCGSKRGTKINCTNDCRHYPFSVAGYDLLKKLESGLVRKLCDYSRKHIGQPEGKKIIESMFYEEEPYESAKSKAVGSAIEYMMFLRKDKDNRTLSQNWKAAGWEGLSKDERMMMEFRMAHPYATVIEVQRVIDSQTLECVDLLDPDRGRFHLLDRAITGSIPRCTKLFAWINYYPHFGRFGNDAIEVPDIISDKFMSEAGKRFEKKSAEDPGLSLKRFLSDNFGYFCGMLNRLSRENTQKVLKGMDLYNCRAVYDIKSGYEKVKALLDELPDFEESDEEKEDSFPGAIHYDWLRLGESRKLEEKMPEAFRHDDESPGIGSLGKIILIPQSLLFEAFSKQKYAFGKKMLEKYFRDKIVLRKETVVDIARQLAEDIKQGKERPAPDDAEEIPLEIRRKLAQDLYKKQYRTFLDEGVPALDGMTPRKAAKMPSMRPRLVELMKFHLNAMEKQNRDENLGVDIGWVLDELGLDELK